MTADGQEIQGSSLEATRSTTGRSRRPNEAAIFAASVDAFGHHGFNGASMRAIATKAGTSLSNLYNYVPAKADLLATVLRQANDQLLVDLHAALESAGDSATERLTALVRGYVLWSAREQKAGIVAMGEFRYLSGGQRSQVVAARDLTQSMFTETVVRGAEHGEFKTPHPRAAARNIVLLCSALATWYRPGGSSTSEQIATEQVRLALGMVEASELQG